MKHQNQGTIETMSHGKEVVDQKHEQKQLH